MLLPESAEDDATALARGRNPPDLAAEEVGSRPAARGITALYPPYRMMPGLKPQPRWVHAPPGTPSGQC